MFNVMTSQLVVSSEVWVDRLNLPAKQLKYKSWSFGALEIVACGF